MTVRKPNESDIDYALRTAREFASELSQYDGLVLPKAVFSRARDVISLIGMAEQNTDHSSEAARALARSLKERATAQGRLAELYKQPDIQPGSLEAFTQGRLAELNKQPDIRIREPAPLGRSCICLCFMCSQ